MDLDEVADRLYALPPPEFTAARAAEARAAKAAGDARLAREIAGLRKPTVSAWAVNRAAREHPDEVAGLLEVGERLRAAWQEQDAAALAELTRRRGEVTGRLGRLIRQDGELSAAAAAEVDQTLDAAVVDAGAAAQVRLGRLAKPLAYSGFAPAPAPRGRTGGAPGKKPAPEDEAAARRAREEAEARKARERAEAEAAHREWREALEAAQRDHDERAAKVERLERKLAKARGKLADSGHRLEVARREERHARQRLDRL
ncbi:hypothetical protein MF672_022745 [Actinomadura sp. ATCC 31491]|uniref:Transposase n=1 Tax=Actinomadura luzonensis TaxID=2805427 RepID=A0ABT0FW71_9ACTN|nr:hypothetical protein [Actinomadura luzonensis]MCK2216597.1 hypothetical protein [Actinomadura luzonensis]